MQLIGKLLDPKTSDIAALNVGKLINKLIVTTGEQLGPLLGDLLKAVLNRLELAKMPSLIQVTTSHKILFHK